MPTPADEDILVPDWPDPPTTGNVTDDQPDTSDSPDAGDDGERDDEEP